MSFQINDIYRDNIPRGNTLLPHIIEWDSSTPAESSSKLESDANRCIRVKGIAWSAPSLSFTAGASTPELLTISYPNIDYSSSKVINIDSLEQLALLSSKKIEINSIEYNYIEFDAPVLLRASKTIKDITITLKATSIDAGALRMAILGWEMLESNWGFPSE